MITITIEDFENLERIEKLCKESKEWIFRCGRAACPEVFEPPVRSW